MLLLSLTRNIDRTVSNLLCADLDKTLETINENNCGFNSLIVFEELPFNREDKNQNVPRTINERLALTIVGTELAEDYNLDNLVMSEEEILNVENARKIFPDVVLNANQLSMLVAISSELEVEGFRQVFFAITVSKIIAAIHAASAEDCIKGVLVHTPTARAASKESPAPARSIGLANR